MNLMRICEWYFVRYVVISGGANEFAASAPQTITPLNYIVKCFYFNDYGQI